ncbi:MAG: hypothetical protein HY331_17260, partial [Chloroflexi bacterium]|nr:hypothetical protein [Chloroflexota bacterium]
PTPTPTGSLSPTPTPTWTSTSTSSASPTPTATAGVPNEVLDVRQSNVNDVSFTLSFLSKYPSVATVGYWISGTNPVSRTLAHDFRTAPGETHWVRVGGSDGFGRLMPSTAYQFNIYLDEGTDPVYTGTVSTGPTLDPRTYDGAWGRVLDQWGYPMSGALVYLTVEDLSAVLSTTASVSSTSALLSAHTDENGWWSVDLAGARTRDVSAQFEYGPSDVVHLAAVAGPAGLAYGDPPATWSSWPFDLHLREVVQRTITLGNGWNALGLPLEPTHPLSVSQLAQMVNGDGVSRLTSAFRYAVGTWHGVAVSGTILMNPMDDFQLKPGEGYFLRMNSPFDWQVTGFAITSPIPLRLGTGWNLVGVPAPGGVSATDLSDNARTISGTTTFHVREVARWIWGTYEGHVSGYPFNNFPVADTQAYFIRAEVAGTLIPGTPGYFPPGFSPQARVPDAASGQATALHPEAVLPGRRRLAA